jgi:hypothetical protein
MLARSRRVVEYMLLLAQKHGLSSVCILSFAGIHMLLRPAVALFSPLRGVPHALLQATMPAGVPLFFFHWNRSQVVVNGTGLLLQTWTA